MEKFDNNEETFNINSISDFDDNDITQLNKIIEEQTKVEDNIFPNWNNCSLYRKIDEKYNEIDSKIKIPESEFYQYDIDTENYPLNQNYMFYVVLKFKNPAIIYKTGLLLRMFAKHIKNIETTFTENTFIMLFNDYIVGYWTKDFNVCSRSLTALLKTLLKFKSINHIFSSFKYEKDTISITATTRETLVIYYTILINCTYRFGFIYETISFKCSKINSLNYNFGLTFEKYELLMIKEKIKNGKDSEYVPILSIFKLNDYDNVFRCLRNLEKANNILLDGFIKAKGLENVYMDDLYKEGRGNFSKLYTTENQKFLRIEMDSFDYDFLPLNHLGFSKMFVIDLKTQILNSLPDKGKLFLFLLSQERIFTIFDFETNVKLMEERVSLIYVLD